MLNDVYKKVEEEKKNEVKSSVLKMTREEFVNEHRHLVSVLRSGDKKAQEAEANKQEKEMMDKTGEGVSDDKGEKETPEEDEAEMDD